MLLLGVELVRGTRVSGRVGALLAIAAMAAIVSNVGAFRDGGRYLRSSAQDTVASLGALELARAAGPARHRRHGDARVSSARRKSGSILRRCTVARLARRHARRNRDEIRAGASRRRCRADRDPSRCSAAKCSWPARRCPPSGRRGRRRGGWRRRAGLRCLWCRCSPAGGCRARHRRHAARDRRLASSRGRSRHGRCQAFRGRLPADRRGRCGGHRRAADRSRPGFRVMASALTPARA